MCSATRLTQNSFNNHVDAGISLFHNGTEIGQQLLRVNTWNSSGVGKEAFMQYSGYIGLPNQIIQVRKSLFRIQTFNQNTIWWADPRIVNAGGNDPFWFVGPEEGPPVLPSICVQTPYPDKGGLDGIEKGIINGNHSPYRGFAANTWESEFQLYDKLMTAPDLRPSGSDADNWYQNKYTTNLGKMVRVYRGMVALTEPLASGSASQLLTDLNAITTEVQYEQNIKTVLQFALIAASSENSNATAAQLSELQSIALQCRYQGGLGVAMSRAMLKMSPILENDCPENLADTGSEDRMAKNETDHIVQVYPNPATTVLQVRMSRALTNGRIALFNLAGQQIRQWFLIQIK